MLGLDPADSFDDARRGLPLDRALVYRRSLWATRSGCDGDMKLRVECRAGHRGEPEPVVIDFGTRRVEVRSIDDRWLATSHRYFRVTGTDGDIYILRHDSESGDWALGAYRSRSAE